jgi:hypothetical protein
VLSYYDEMDDARVTREFWVPQNGGYVHEITSERPGTLGQQVCDGLCNRGSTLSASRQGLLHCIRREYRSMRRAEQREREAR